MRILAVFAAFSCLVAISLSAQVMPINHNMKNLKVGNTFVYNFKYWIVRSFSELQKDIYFLDRIVRYDTIGNKQYAVFQNGVKERADSSGVYWIPLGITGLDGITYRFSKEYLRYPLFRPQSDSLTILKLGSDSFMYPWSLPDSSMNVISYRINPDTNAGIFGIKKRLFHLSAYLLGDLQYYEYWGPQVYSNSGGGRIGFRTNTTLCGAIIEGTYYGDSACLVASSTPLRGEEFTSFTASLAPNPASDIATLRFILPTAQGLTVQVCDMLGREVAPPLVFDALSSGMNALPIEVAGLPRGVYALRLRTTQGLWATTMLVKQ